MFGPIANRCLRQRVFVRRDIRQVHCPKDFEQLYRVLPALIPIHPRNPRHFQLITLNVFFHYLPHNVFTRIAKQLALDLLKGNQRGLDWVYLEAVVFVLFLKDAFQPLKLVFFIRKCAQQAFIAPQMLWNVLNVRFEQVFHVVYKKINHSGVILMRLCWLKQRLDYCEQLINFCMLFLKVTYSLF